MKLRSGEFHTVPKAVSGTCESLDTAQGDRGVEELWEEEGARVLKDLSVTVFRGSGHAVSWL